jgi:teichuronic acid exporter
MLWSLSENLGLQAMGFLISIILARLLLPEQFGLIGMLALFMALSQSILDSGFGSALIQKKDADHTDFCSIFYFNLVLGFLLTLLLFLGAPLVAGFFEQPILVPLTRVLALNVLINGFGLIHTVLLTKTMDFKSLWKISLTSVAVSGVVGIGLAFLGYGVWSLAIQSVANTMLRTALLWATSPWRPSRMFSLHALKQLFSYGSKLLASGLLDTFFVNIYQVFIGKVFSVTDLGYFVRAKSMQGSLIHSPSTSLAKVIFPALAPLQDDKARLAQVYRKAIQVTVFFHFPLVVGLLVVADPLIRVLMTDRWAPSVIYFQLLCIVGVFYPLQVLNLNILKVKGRSDLFLRLEIIKKTLVVLSIFITYRWGVAALLYGQIVTSTIAYFLNSSYSGCLVDYPTQRQLADILPYFLISLAMGGVAYAAGRLPFEHDLPRLLAQTSAGVLAYPLICRAVRLPLLGELLQMAKQFVRVLPATH